jgi:hypothetical protein
MMRMCSISNRNNTISSLCIVALILSSSCFRRSSCRLWCCSLPLSLVASDGDAVTPFDTTGLLGPHETDPFSRLLTVAGRRQFCLDIELQRRKVDAARRHDRRLARHISRPQGRCVECKAVFRHEHGRDRERRLFRVSRLLCSSNIPL